jgi:putative ABC transport system permease protein
VGVLAPTGTPNDRGVFINMEGFYLIEGHAKPVDNAAAPHAEAGHDEKHSHDEAHEHEKKHDAHEDEKKHDEETHAAEGTPAPPANEQHDDKAHAPESPAAPAPDEKHAHDEKAHDEKAHAPHEHEGHDHKAHGHAPHGHEAHEHHHEPLPIEEREVTAILLLTGGPVPGIYSASLLQQVNEGRVAQAVHPIREIAVLFMTFVDPLRTVLLCLTVLIVIVSGIGILVSIYNSMSERRHEIAVIRALGAGRRTVMFIVLLESILLSLLGGLAGWLVGHALIGVLSPWISQQTGVSVGFMQFVNYELVIIPGLILLATLVGYLPAMAAYRTDVAKALSTTP